jgi:hypothetical protein
MLASKSIGDEDTGAVVTEFAPGVDAEQVVAVLWREALWPDGSGLYGRSGDIRDPTDHPAPRALGRS